MHHTFYGIPKTSCGATFAKVRGKVTGLDSQVTCNDCLIELAKYREHFPQASNREDEDGRPIMEGGAR